MHETTKFFIIAAVLLVDFLVAVFLMLHFIRKQQPVMGTLVAGGILLATIATAVVLYFVL